MTLKRKIVPRERASDLVQTLPSEAVAHKFRQVQNDVGWIDLGYVSGMPEFTVLQINLLGDWTVTEDMAKRILEFATKVVTQP